MLASCRTSSFRCWEGPAQLFFVAASTCGMKQLGTRLLHHHSRDAKQRNSEGCTDPTAIQQSLQTTQVWDPKPSSGNSRSAGPPPQCLLRMPWLRLPRAAACTVPGPSGWQVLRGILPSDWGRIWGLRPCGLPGRLSSPHAWQLRRHALESMVLRRRWRKHWIARAATWAAHSGKVWEGDKKPKLYTPSERHCGLFQKEY